MSRPPARPPVSYPVEVRYFSTRSSRRAGAPGLSRLTGLGGLGVVGLALTACGPSLVAMDDSPITSSTPSRAAGEELIRSGEPDENCAPEPLPADEGATARVAVSLDESKGERPQTVQVPTDPQRILALGYGAADAACALGLQDRVAATSALPADADAVLPSRLTEAPRVDPTDPAFAAQVADIHPDVVLVGNDAGINRDRVGRLVGDDSVPVIFYESESSATSWSDAAALAGAALGHEKSMNSLLRDFIASTDEAAKASNPQDTRVSVVQFSGTEPHIASPDILGVRVLTAMGASRPPSQLVSKDGNPETPPVHNPAVGDPLSGDVIFSIEPSVPGGQDDMRKVFESERWKALPADKDRRVFVVQPAVWEGRGLAAARVAVGDIAGNVNRFAADG